jgi:hypothetical protein
VGEAYYSEPLGNLQTLAARLDYIKGNQGSGEGWHRDSIKRQFKAILFLTDVNIHSGPFEIFAASHRILRILSDCFVMNVSVLNDRFAPSEINLLLSKQKSTKIQAKMGTLVLVDTSAIHRGSPICFGSRYALTNYYYPLHEIASRKDDFQPSNNENY